MPSQVRQPQELPQAIFLCSSTVTVRLCQPHLARRDMPLSTSTLIKIPQYSIYLMQAQHEAVVPLRLTFFLNLPRK